MGELIALADRRALILGRKDSEYRRRHATDDLIGATLRWRSYRAWNSGLVRAECALCQAPFGDDGSRRSLLAGYSVVSGGPADQHDFVWICGLCYEQWASWYRWKVEVDPRPTLVRPCLDSADEP